MRFTVANFCLLHKLSFKNAYSSTVVTRETIILRTRYVKQPVVNKGLRKERLKELKRDVTKRESRMRYVAVFVENSS
ncbi:hypothetical protein TNCV_4108711 [Trichonephila clavipes]|nr:hypothetical protein TNCV_4108711 [Trichonephila clavipes]